MREPRKQSEAMGCSGGGIDCGPATPGHGLPEHSEYVQLSRAKPDLYARKSSLATTERGTRSPSIESEGFILKWSFRP